MNYTDIGANESNITFTLFDDNMQNHSDQAVNVTYSQPSYDNTDYILWVLNEKLFYSRFLPASIYVGIMAICGCLSNGTVVCVYKSRRKWNTANAFIFCLGVVDLLICLFVMPFRLFDMRFPLLFGYAVMCKGYELVEIFLSMTSITLMTCIAIDRWWIVTRPLKRMELEKINRAFAICFLVALCSSWPTLLIYGESKVPTSNRTIFGSTCGVSDAMKTSIYTKTWYYFLYLVFVVTLIILIILYLKIWLKIKNWKNSVIGESVNDYTPRQSIVSERRKSECIPYGTNKRVNLCKYIPMQSFSTDPQTASDEDNFLPLVENSSDFSTISFSCSTMKTPRKDSLFLMESDLNVVRLFPRNRRRSSGVSLGKRVRMRRNTIVFGAISAIFILSYLPCLVVICLRTLQIYQVTLSKPLDAQVAEIFIRSGYISCVLNPCIYSFMCPSFRKGVKELLFQY